MKSKQFSKISLLLILLQSFWITPVNTVSANMSSSGSDLSNKLKGRILLQTESRGEAWYINPSDAKRHYLGRPDDAFQVMRKLGLGISNQDFASFKGYAPQKLAGRILLKVEDSGKAYYVNPVDLKMYYLGRPTDAFRVMREKGLGITNQNLSSIPTATNNQQTSTTDTSTTNPTTNTPTTDSNKEITVKNVSELMATVNSTKSGNVTVLIEDGTYEMSNGLWLTGEHITYKSKSGNRDKVILKSSFKASHIFWIASKYVTISDISIGEVNNHGIQVMGEKGASYTHVKNVRFFDIKEQMLKGSASSADIYNEGGIVEDCLFEFTKGKAYQYYTGGIDVHKGKNWIVRNNTFKNIQNPGGNLTEGAIHFWNHSVGTLIENNKIINCDRGIMLGLDNSPHDGGKVINNEIQVNTDVGIYLCNSTNSTVSGNKIYNDSSYPNSIEYRFSTRGSVIENNNTNKNITSRNGGEATVKNNTIDQKMSKIF